MYLIIWKKMKTKDIFAMMTVLVLSTWNVVLFGVLLTVISFLFYFGKEIVPIPNSNWVEHDLFSFHL